jgi:hypothetical protein
LEVFEQIVNEAEPGLPSIWILNHFLLVNSEEDKFGKCLLQGSVELNLRAGSRKERENS